MSDELPSLTSSAQPADYLQGGFFAAPGQIRPELTGLASFAVARYFLESEVSPDEVATTLTALREVLPALPGTASEKYAEGVTEALGLVSNMVHIVNNPGLRTWLLACTPFIQTDEDLTAFLTHFQTITAQYGALVAVS